MLNRFLYIVFFLVSAPGVLLAKTGKCKEVYTIVSQAERTYLKSVTGIADTVKFNKAAVKAELKLKELPKPKRQPKPEKVEDEAAKKVKAKRERRPDGMDRPPEIPRRNDN